MSIESAVFIRLVYDFEYSNPATTVAGTVEFEKFEKGTCLMIVIFAEMFGIWGFGTRYRSGAVDRRGSDWCSCAGINMSLLGGV
jgi:hypothetical protein